VEWEAWAEWAAWEAWASNFPFIFVNSSLKLCRLTPDYRDRFELNKFKKTAVEKKQIL
jgi:hypothetical protein